MSSWCRRTVASRCGFRTTDRALAQSSRSTYLSPTSLRAQWIGLGLYIARFLMEPYGRLQYGEECQLNGACFEALFEKSVGG